MQIRRLLIANRGEIARRIIRTARALGITTLAVYSDADRASPHVREADEAWHLGPAPALDSYLNIERLLEVALHSGADAIHPGYGFLSENPEFARACLDCGLVFVGPSPEAMAVMGDKAAAKRLMAQAGVPLLPGYHGSEQDDAALERAACTLGFPLIIKPANGGGGKGMQRVGKLGEFRDALHACQRQAQAAFGSAQVILERYLPQPRHIEVQIFGDRFGHLVSIGERDCSVQRRHQKVLEEAPASGLSPALRHQLHQAALQAGRAVHYQGAGTVEFLLDGEQLYFLEMNTRLQVEHPVTELISGLDLVEWQLAVAAGSPLPLRQEQIQLNGHAIEVRLYAEDPQQDFLPAVGTISHWHLPTLQPGQRVDSGIETGSRIGPDYDPMLAKLCAYGTSRSSALARLSQLLDDCRLDGVGNNLGWLRQLLAQPAIQHGAVDTHFLSEHGDILNARPLAPTPHTLLLAALAVLYPDLPTNAPLWQQLAGFRLNTAAEQQFTLYDEQQQTHPLHALRHADGWQITLDERQYLARAQRDGQQLQVWLEQRAFLCELAWHGTTLQLYHAGRCHRFSLEPSAQNTACDSTHQQQLLAPLPGRIISCQVSDGQQVEAGQPLATLEAMKMEYTLRAPQTGTIRLLALTPGINVAEGALLAELYSPPAS